MPLDSPPFISQGRMVFELRDYGDGVLIPNVTFEPVGKITMGSVDRHITHLYQKIHQAQAAARHPTGLASQGETDV